MAWIKDIFCSCKGFLKVNDSSGKIEIECTSCHKKITGNDSSKVLDEYKKKYGTISAWRIRRE